MQIGPTDCSAISLAASDQSAHTLAKNPCHITSGGGEYVDVWRRNLGGGALLGRATSSSGTSMLLGAGTLARRANLSGIFMTTLGLSEEGSRTAPPALGAARALVPTEVILQLVGQKG